MVFASNVFLFLFLPAFLAVYYLAPARLRSYIIALASYAFYGWWRPDFLTLVLFSTVVDYTCGQRIADAQARGEKGKPWVTASVLINLGLLGYFKYANFGVASFNAILVSLGLEPATWAAVVLPVGISFYTFQTMSYTIDVYRGDAPPVKSFRDFMCYVALFPQLVAGPIVRYSAVAEQLHSRTHSFEKLSEGGYRFMVGFCKKVLVADTVAPLVDAAFALPDPSFADAWLGALAYTIQLYFDFSGYSDMAIGLGLMMGFRFPENFDHPYISRNITEFWQRWHISLSTWLRDYLYIPLGGNRHGPGRTYVNLALVMLLGGLWHGANWTFLVWGAWHGGILAVERRFSRKEGRRRVVRPLPIPFVMLLVILGWVVFRAPDLSTAIGFYVGMIGANGWALSDAMAWQVGAWPLTMMLLGFFIVYSEPVWRRRVAESGRWQRWEWVFVPLFALALLRLSAQSYTPFLYFQF
ncbi:MAG: MBOAT family protein [Alphaproteobacteria bacterium]|nr:MBOAT family protein [Alphaproteobacteria bacterium]MCB9791435.1 MBOAT family protein [Alphaproteobacteria bacterium]